MSLRQESVSDQEASLESPVIVHELPAAAASGQWARRLLDENLRVEPVRLAEAQLMATELVSHFVEQSTKSPIEVRLVTTVPIVGWK